MRNLLPYAPPSIGDVDLDLSRNEGRPPSTDVLGQVGDPLTLMSRYPDTTALRNTLAERHDLPPGRVLVTAGADDALFRCFLARVGPGRDAVATYPSFEMLPRYAAQAGGRLVQISWWEEDFPVDEMTSALANGARTAFVVSPNNPTGNVATIDDLDRVAEAAELVVLDGAYTEFADLDLTSKALEHDNVVVLRSLSKAWGLAGLRVGYMLGPESLVDEIGAYGNPYPVTGLSQAIAIKRFESANEVQGFVREVARERTLLTETLSGLGVDALPSRANFVLAEFDDPGWVVSAVSSLGIGLRRFPDRPGLGNHLRIGLPGDPDAFDRLSRAMRSAIRPQALLFDIDGVLADVDGSQTAAIIATAATLGVDVERRDVEEARAAGNANDDWALTWRLCTTAGADVSIDEVRSVFETLYQGSDGRPGLKEGERLLVGHSVLEGWAQRWPIGLVTGRPLADAREFIAGAGIGDCVSTLVTREDAPLKPDPKPVELALERLGVTDAWMVGDTPDDISAARAAGVVPIGVIAPGTNPQTSRRALSGAAAVLDKTTDLEELLR